MLHTAFVPRLPLAKKDEAKNRDDRIRTCDILLPKQARYQAALHPGPHSNMGCSVINRCIDRYINRYLMNAQRV